MSFVCDSWDVGIIGLLPLSVSPIIQPSVVVCPPTLVRKTALKEAHDTSRAWSRIAISHLQLPIEIRPGAVGAASVLFRKAYGTELIAYSCRDPSSMREHLTSSRSSVSSSVGAPSSWNPALPNA